MKPIPELSKSDLKRFWSKVNKSGECWLWAGSYRQSQRSRKLHYGAFRVGGKNYLSHRISYAITNGDPGEFCVCHACDNPLCVNPNHLWLGTIQEDMNDRDEKERQARGENQGSSKLTNKQVKEILESDEIHRVLAEQYGVSRSNITMIKIGKRWKHVERETSYE